MKNLYPEIEPYQVDLLKVSKLYEIYIEQSGNPKGKPIIVIHGGPGAHSKPKHRRYYNPKKYRIIIFDQRGCGQSKPQGELRENTTWDLVDDIEKIRKFLKIEKWHICGGSWGSTLALAYSEKYPKRVKAIILRGVFTFRKSEVDWLYEKGASYFFPESFEQVPAIVSKNERKNLTNAYVKKLLKGNRNEQKKAALAWSKWERSVSQLIPDEDHEEINTSELINSGRIMAHYVKNNGFMKEGELIKNATKLKNIPGVIIQGRYDLVSLPITAWEISRKWSKAKLEMVPDAGHSGSEPGTRSKIIEYSEKFSKL